MKYLNLVIEFIQRIFFIIPKKPMTAQIEITNKCNFDCKMCQRNNLGVKFEDMSLENYEKILDSVKNIKNIILTGWGEPFIHPQIFEMIKLAKKRGHTVRLTSNGSLLTKEFRTKIIESGLDAITFSIDSVETNQNEFGHLLVNQLENIKNLIQEKNIAKSKLQVYFQSTLHKDTEDEIIKIIEFAIANKVSRVRISRLDIRFNNDLQRPTKQEEINFVKKLLKLNHKIGIDFLPYLAFDGILSKIYFMIYPILHKNGKYCLRTFSDIYINQELNVTPCCSLPLLSMGNINEKNIKEIWQEDKFKNFRKNQETICGKCDVLSINPKNEK